MKKILLLCALSLFIFSCNTKDNFIDTGISNGKHDCTMLEYLKSSSYDWDSTVLVIKRASLEHMFDGTDSKYKQITFWGPTNHSIRRFMLDNKYETVNDIPVELCRKYMLNHIVIGRYMKSDIAFSTPSVTAEIIGGTIFTCEGGSQIKAYKVTEAYGDVDGAGAVKLRLYSITTQQKIPMASPDIETNTGVVHSLNGGYTFGNI